MLVLVIVLVVAAFALIMFDARRGATRVARERAEEQQGNTAPKPTSSGRVTPKRGEPNRSSPRAGHTGSQASITPRQECWRASSGIGALRAHQVTSAKQL